MSDDNTLLKKLLEQEAALKLKIKEARRQDEKKKAQIRNNKAKIIGMAILAEIETNEALKQSLQPVINKQVTNEKDRKFLGLPPLSQNQPSPAPNTHNLAPTEPNSETATRSSSF